VVSACTKSALSTRKRFTHLLERPRRDGALVALGAVCTAEVAKEQGAVAVVLEDRMRPADAWVLEDEAAAAAALAPYHEPRVRHEVHEADCHAAAENLLI